MLRTKNYKHIALNYLIPISLCLIAFFWKFAYIDSRDICLDEPFTIFHAQKSVLDILKLPSQNEPNPPLFMLLLHFWMKLFGTTPTVIRLLPLLFNALTPIFLYLTGKKLVNVWSGLIAAGMFIFSTYHFYYGLETRTYSLLSFGTGAALFFFVSLVKEPQRRFYFLGLIAADVLMIYSHYFGWFVVFIQAILCLFYIKEKGFIKKMAMVIGITGILFIPMAIVFAKQFLKSKQGTWVSVPKSYEYFYELKQLVNSFWVLVVLCSLGIVGFYLLIKNRPGKKEIKELAIVFLWWFVPYSLMFVVSYKIPMFINRYILFNSIGLYIFIAFFVGLSFERKKYWTLLVTLAIMISMLITLQINPRDEYYREVKNAISHAENLTDSNTIIIIHPHWASLGFTYYFDRSVFEDVKNYENRLNSSHIYPVWNLDFAKEAIQNNPDCRIVYYQDGSTFTDGNNTIFKYLDSVYTRVDSVFYPQCFNVSAFIKDASK